MQKKLPSSETSTICLRLNLLVFFLLPVGIALR